MGGGGSKVVYRTDKTRVNKLQAGIEKRKQEAAKAKAQAKALQDELNRLRQASESTRQRLQRLQADFEKREAELNDPSRLLQNEEELFGTYLKEIGKMVPELVRKQKAARQTDDRLVLAVAGKVSSGKSTTLNAMMGEKVQATGLGRTTTEPREVGSITTLRGHIVRLIDFPGDDRDFDYLDLDTLEYMASVDAVLIVYDNTPEYCSRFIRLAVTLGKHLLFARNKVDRAGPYERTGAEYVTLDKLLLAKLGVKSPLVSAISARNVYRGKTNKVEGKASEKTDLYQWKKMMADINSVAEAVSRQVSGSSAS